MKVSEIMTGTVELVSPETGVRDAAKRMADEDVGALPVGDDDELVGMVTDRDIAIRGVGEGKPIDGCTVAEVMSTGVLYCFDDADVADVADNMAQNQVRRLPVVNADKRLVGMVALADLARAGLGERAAVGISEPSAAARAVQHGATPP